MNMFNISKENLVQRNRLISAIILLFGLLSFAIIVYADVATTSVTVGNAAPVVSALTLDRTTITPVENTSTWASSTLTVTDSNGCSQITTTTATLYLASTTNSGTTCTYNGNSCYTSTCVATTTGNTCTGGADTAVEYDCGFQVWYTATPTDASSPFYASSIWSVSATTTDGTAEANATNTAQTVEVATLNALNVTASISYGSVSANSDTGATNQSTTITNTGNTAQDTELSGTDMCLSGVCTNGYFGANQQKYGLTNVTYASLTALPATTSAAVSVATVLAKPTATTSAITDIVFWGVGVPVGQTPGSYTGTDTFTAITDTND